MPKPLAFAVFGRLLRRFVPLQKHHSRNTSLIAPDLSIYYIQETIKYIKSLSLHRILVRPLFIQKPEVLLQSPHARQLCDAEGDSNLAAECIGLHDHRTQGRLCFSKGFNRSWCRSLGA